MDEYIKYFKEKQLKKITINKDEKFYRGRIGKMIVEGAIDDCNKQFIMPYYKSMIEAAPPIYTSGGRFNRAGVSYLYLTTDLQTCFAEVLNSLNSEGLYFKSVQSTGYNIVCFNPDNFKLEEYSEKLYKANKITYEFNQVEDAIREFAEREDEHLINDFNEKIVEENEKQIEYLLKWIEKEKTLKNKE